MGNQCFTEGDVSPQCVSEVHRIQQQASMQGCKCGATKIQNRPVGSAKTYNRPAPMVDGCGRIHVVVCALNYSSTRIPLACSLDGQSFVGLAQACGADDVQVLSEQQCTRDNIASVMRYVGLECGPDDYVIFYFSGRTTRFTSRGGPPGKNNQDGEQVFCFVDDEGQVTPQSFMSHAELTDIITASIPQEVRTIILTESPLIADLGTPAWKGREAISLAGCLSPDEEASMCADTGSGGSFTHSLLLAVERLQQLGEYDYSVGMLYNTALEECARVFNQRCDLFIQPSASTACHEIAWPLVPRKTYRAPLSRLAYLTDRDAQNYLSADPKDLVPLGIRPQLLRSLRLEAVSMRPQPEYARAVEPENLKCVTM